MQMALVREKVRSDHCYDRCQTQKLREGNRWGNVETDVLQVFTTALLGLRELQKPRQQINQIVEEIIKEEEAMRVVEAETKEAKKVEPEPVEVFIYGQDAQRIQAVVTDSIVGKIKTTKYLEAITIHNQRMSSSEEVRSYLQYEWRKLEDITSVVVILHDVTENNLVKFRESGFVSFCKERKSRIHVICWSSLHTGESLHPSLLRAFGKLVFIPSSPEEEPWVQKVEVEATINEAGAELPPPTPSSPKGVRNETEPGPSQFRRPIDTKLLNAFQPPRPTFGLVDETKQEIGWVVPPPPRSNEAAKVKPPLLPKPQGVNGIKTANGNGNGPVLSPTPRPMPPAENVKPQVFPKPALVNETKMGREPMSSPPPRLMPPGHHEGSRSFASVAFVATASDHVVEITDAKMDKREGNDDHEDCLCCLDCIVAALACFCD